MAEPHDHQIRLWANFRQPMPLWRKLLLALSNSVIKIKTRRNCCGNLGQPGC